MVRRRRSSIALVLALVLAGAPVAAAEPASPEVPAEIDDPIAREHFTIGMQAWLADDYATAQRELEAAYAIDAEPVLLYALGQLERLQGRCDRARERFAAFLASDPPAAAAEDARVNLERCRTVEPEPPPPRVEPPPPAPPPARPRPDPLGIALTSVGSVVVLAGLGLFGGSFVEQRRAADASDVGGFDRALRRARIEHATGLALAGVGAAVLVGGIIRIALARRRTPGSHRSARAP